MLHLLLGLCRVLRSALLLLFAVGMAVCLPAVAATQDSARRIDLGGPWTLRAVAGTRAGKALTADDPAWRARTAHVPAAFEHELGADFDGVVEYVREVDVERPRDAARLRLRFGAVMTHARVFFNGRELGEHLGGWTPFAFDLPGDAFRDEGPQQLRVLVDERVGHATQGFLPDISPHFGGIWQDVVLEVVPRGHVPSDALELATRVEANRRELTLRVAKRYVTRDFAVEASLIGDDAVLEVTPQEALEDGDDVLYRWNAAGAESWSPARPVTFEAIVTLRSAARAIGRAARRVAFCDIQGRGRHVLLNGREHCVRGILHWGYAPPFHAPLPPETYWLEELRFAKACGFDTIKACLWLPPPRFFELALREGLLVWVEYPAWHPDFSAKKRAELLAEYGEFFRADRAWPHVIARSLTCETGHSSDAGVVQALFDECKRVTRGGLVEDDSSWITWNRFHDFYDDHPYGNPVDWVGRLRGFDAYIREKGAKPFLLGEAIAGDTWVELERLEARIGELRDDAGPWWRPHALGAMRAFEDDLEAAHGRAARARLVAASKDQALRLRKYQLEALRRELPSAGYVVSVMRDFKRARMGFFDDLGAPKWEPEAFAWHGERMLVLDDARPLRSLRKGELASVAPRLRVVAGAALEADSIAASVHIGEAAAAAPQRVVVEGRHADLANSWTFWACPEVSTAVPDGVRVASGLDAATLDWVVGGGRLLLLKGKGAMKSRGLWFLEGGPYAGTTHALFDRVPLAMVEELQAFDLHGPVFEDTELVRAFSTVLGYWDTHDERETVRRYGLVLEASVGRGRILATTLGLDDAPELPFAATEAMAKAPNPARAFVRAALLAHLAEGSEPARRLTVDWIDRLRAGLTSEVRELDGTWWLKPDPQRVGTKERWFEAPLEAEAWIASKASSHWEAAGLPQYTGQAWYRRDFTPPPTWKPGEPLWLVCDGVDDSYEVFVNGRAVATHGDEARGETVWLVRTSTDIGPATQQGVNRLALRVVDHVGAGGLHRPVRLQTSRPEAVEVLDR